MILVDNQPILTLPKDDERRIYFESESKKIKAKRESIVFKKESYYHLSNGKRRKPATHAVQTVCELISNRGIEMWGYCRTYKKDPKTEQMSLSPNMLYFNKAKYIKDPQKDFEEIFYLTSIVGLQKFGYAIDNPEQEAKDLNDKEIAELDVQYAIKRKLDDDELRYYSKAWGISYADKLGIEQLRRTLFDTVKKSQENYDSTHKGYKEFMEEVLNKRPEVTEARAIVNMAIDKGYLAINNLTRRVTYVPANEYICLVPIEDKDRVTDYLADFLLKDKNKELYETIKVDTTGAKPEFTMSIADVDQLRTREELDATAAKLNIQALKNWKDETVRQKIIEKLQTN